MDAPSKTHLPHEIMELILSECDVRTVIRFRCVSSSWRSTISGPEFFRTLETKRSRNRNQNRYMFLTFGAVDVVYALLEPSSPCVDRVLCYQFHDQVKSLGTSDVDTSVPVPVDIPEELIEVILSKCPVESVVRFKSVSRSWQSLISSHHFSLILQSKSLENQNKFLVFTYADRCNFGNFDLVLLQLIRSENGVEFRTESIPGYPEHSDGILVLPLCSCDGLMLLEMSVGSVKLYRHILWNPFARKYIMIPLPEIPPRSRGADYVRLHYHLYHDSITDDYKIVCLSANCYRVYSCKSRRWGAIVDFRRNLLRLMREFQAFEAAVDGCFYLMREDKIVCFDCRYEKLHEFRQPDELKTLVRVRLEVVSERLCLFGFSGNGYEMLHLWVVEKKRRFEYSWKKLISMEKAEPDMWNPAPECFTSEDDVVLQAQVRGGSFKLFMYSRSNRRFQVIPVSLKFSTCYPYYPYRKNPYLLSSNAC